MKSPTARRPDSQQPARSSKSRKYVRQTAHIEARRDGKPLIFGWGGHLSRNEKVHIQRRAIWSMAILISAIIVTVVISFWINLSVITPNQPITSVNGQNIPQSDYRNLIVFKAQWELSLLRGPNGLETRRNDLSKQLAEQQSIIDSKQTEIDEITTQLETASDDQHAGLEQQRNEATTAQETAQTQFDEINLVYSSLQARDIPNQEARYTQMQLGGETINWLQEDILIRNWLQTQDTSVQELINPTAVNIDRAMQTFKANIPGTEITDEKYNRFLAQYGVSDANMRAMMALKMRRDNLNGYLRGQIVSPALQVQVSSITLATEQEAEDLLKQLQGQDAETFANLAKEKSQDTETKENGGDLGWLVKGQYTLDYTGKLDGKVDNWLFDPARKAGDLSPAILDNGSYRIFRITALEEARDVDAEKLKELQANSTPLDIWVISQRAILGDKITPADSAKQYDPINMPANIPYSAPTQSNNPIPQ